MEARRDRLANVGLEVISHGIFARRVAREQQGEYRREQRMSCKEAILRIHYGKDENPAVWVRPRRHSSEPVRIEIGRASCRERVCQYVEISVVAVSYKKKKTN